MSVKELERFLLERLQGDLLAHATAPRVLGNLTERSG